MLRAEQLAATTTESGQPNLSPATGAPVHDPLSCKQRLLFRSRSFHRYFAATFRWIIRSLQHERWAGHRTFIAGKLQICGRCWGCGGCCGGVEALLAHVVRSRITRDAAVIYTESYGFGNLEIGLFLLRPLSHSDFDSDSDFQREKVQAFLRQGKSKLCLERGIWREREGCLRLVLREKEMGIWRDERSVMAMEYGPHRDAYQTFLISFYRIALQTFFLFTDFLNVFSFY